ncbi:WcbI family polysaccharide biosynthesis putative acetyltransferase [Maridesulfovibrio sp.]|uniref:WcbI family polysaccharide biosynthesis putative acetyltransferase n=1 Tax=Maridesulfovibrio sp. TaxID=2795000 RepID=UPI002AA7182D|nr:WcbI family polysaccharide biosynthesis putative acetyltransferase [Maridesulfovibrio sp.]
MKKKCILHANCQGEPIQELLLLSDEFSAEYQIHSFTNYTREFIPDSLLTDCDLFLFQTLNEKWGELASAKLCGRLKKNTRSIAIPNMLFKHYWPLWSAAPGFDYRDTFLDSLLDRDLSESQIMHLFINTRLTNIYDFKEIMDRSEQLERDKESLTPVRYVDWIMENYRKKPLFNTINHPRRELLILTVNTLLEELGMTRLNDKALNGFSDPFTDFEQPIHPQVAEYLGLEFGGPEHRYHVYGAELTFEEYATRYIKCRKNNIEDFITFLMAAARMGQS